MRPCSTRDRMARLTDSRELAQSAARSSWPSRMPIASPPGAGAPNRSASTVSRAIRRVGTSNHARSAANRAARSARRASRGTCSVTSASRRRPGPMRSGGRLGDANGALVRLGRSSYAVARPEHVEHEPPSVVAQDLDHERPPGHDAHRWTRISLTHDGGARPHDQLPRGRMWTARQAFRHGSGLLPGGEAALRGAAPYPAAPTRPSRSGAAPAATD